MNGPLAEDLAYLGMRRCVVVDPKAYKPQSVVSQCGPADVGRYKADVLAERLRRLGVDATPRVEDVYDLPPGWVERDGRWHFHEGSWARRDSDRDGVPNALDRRPYDPTRR